MKNKYTAQGLVTPAGAEVLTDEQAETIEGAIAPFVAGFAVGLVVGAGAFALGVATGFYIENETAKRQGNYTPWENSDKTFYDFMVLVAEKEQGLLKKLTTK